MSDAIIIARKDKVLDLQFNRPDKRNAITAAMYGELARALRDVERDGTTRAVLFRGAAENFTAGNDLADFLDNPPRDDSATVFAFLDALAAASLPFVAAVDGVAIGIGCTLLLHCDFVLVTPRAKLQTPFVNLALVPEAASSLLLPRLMGHVRAAELLMLGEAIDGTRAVALGLANRTVEPDQLFDEAMRLAQDLARKPPAALRATKQLMRAAPRPIGDAMRAEAELFARQLVSKESREAFAAFLEKRPPRFDDNGE